MRNSIAAIWSALPATRLQSTLCTVTICSASRAVIIASPGDMPAYAASPECPAAVLGRCRERGVLGAVEV